MSWQRVRGHQAQVEAFDLIRRRGRLAHAYLFTGPPGVGKRLFAEELAKAFLCEGRPNPAAPLAACDACASCLLIAAGSDRTYGTTDDIIFPGTLLVAQ